MTNLIEKLAFVLRCAFYLPHYLLMSVHPRKKVIKNEILRYCSQILYSNDQGLKAFLKVMAQIPDFRSLYFSRVGTWGILLKPFTSVRVNLHLFTPDDRIGEGLLLHHAFSTAILSRQIGKNCEVWQCVTIGKSKSEPGLDATPLLGSNVKISAGAIVIGKITIGDNSIIGAGSLITKDVPQNVTVVGNPAYIIRRDGERVNERL
ncbi:hypothetical protein LZD49_31880 [Dyadobacter sp. CY261]|uniref:serine O-acetyltransferase n=1 Tax=Dyadobacter sp. CY261 TaxID=2907203 RepID=UPI001F410956|nr:hypothetical protein [Dyadobacter sp. CY261]MCF0075128.1 hypothetical protein [Dyadobacter sp. CY261]